MAQKSLFLPVPVAFGLGLALVGQLFALGDTQLDLHDPTFVEIPFHRNDGHALARRGVPQPRQFALRDQKLATATLFMAPGLRLAIGGDVAVDQPKLAILDAGIAFAQVRPALTQRLDL